MKDRQSVKYPSQLVVDALRLIGYLISKPLWFIRYHGRENIPDNNFGGFLIVANHQTYIDPVWICLPLRRKIRYIAFDKAFEWRFIGPLIRYLGAFPVSLDTGGSVKSMKEALRSLRDGAALMVFPEAAREFADGQMLPFKTGAVRIALQAGVPKLPVTVRGGNRIWPQQQKYPNLFRRAEIIYHPLVHVTSNESLALRDDVAAQTARIKEIISGAEHLSPSSSGT